MFAVTYVPQAAVLTLFNGPLAALTTILLVRMSCLPLSLDLTSMSTDRRGRVGSFERMLTIGLQ
jgi:hypothetical protein